MPACLPACLFKGWWGIVQRNILLSFRIVSFDFLPCHILGLLVNLQHVWASQLEFLLLKWTVTFCGVMDFSEILRKAMDPFLRRVHMLWTYLHNTLGRISGLVEAIG